MASHSGRGPPSPPSRRHAAAGTSPSKPPVNPSASLATFSPRRPTGVRAPGDASSASPTAGSRLATSLALATQDTLMSVNSPPGSANGGAMANPHVRAIQSRVAELVRRYDESVGGSRPSVDDDDDDDAGQLSVPARWRVGDLLLATHSSMAKASTRTERSMASEFDDDADVAAAIGDGEQSFSLVLAQATEKAEQMKAVLARTLQVVQQLQHHDEAEDAAAKGDGSEQRLRDLKVTVDALHKEKSMILGQLHEHVKSNKEMLATMEEQSQELKKAQIAAAMKHDELRNVREDFAARLADHTKMNETTQQNVAIWRDKYQSTLKALGDADAKNAELEQRVQAEGEEVMKHDFILRAKNSELDKYKERLKESEAALREATAAASAFASEPCAANKRAEAASKAKPAAVGHSSDAQAKVAAKERLELEAKIKQHELTIRDLQMRLYELTSTRSKFEDDNNELARIVRELQSRAQEAMDARAPSPPPRMATIRRATSFSLSLKSLTSAKPKRLSTGDESSQRRGAAADDDLSTSSGADDESDSEAERDEKELNDTLREVVASVFPQRVSPMEEQSDELLDSSIAQYEQDPTQTPKTTERTLEVDATTLRRLTASFQSEQQLHQQQPSRPTSRGSVVAGGVGMSVLADVENLQMKHADEITRLKTQYIAGLLEYKKLIIEQYERRQSEIQQQHRLEIENLILLVQEKFKRELERRGERVLQAKESLKLLYRAMQLNGTGGDVARRVSGGKLGVFDEEGDDGDDEDSRGGGAASVDRVEEPVPLKSILRAAVFAMSSSKSRNKQATREIASIYETMGKARKAPRKSAVNVVVNKRDAPPPPEPAANNGDTDWAAFLKSMRANRDGATRAGGGSGKTAAPLISVGCQVDERDFVIFELKGLRGSHVAPENLERYVLPAAGVVARSDRERGDHAAVATTHHRHHHHHHRSGGAAAFSGVLFLNEGALLADDVVVELRALLPFLPPGAYYVSAALRHQLLLVMLRFYAELGRRHGGGSQQQHGRSPREDELPAVEIIVGSPRDTPFLRRKAVEGVERRRRRELLSNGGLAMLRALASPATSTSTPR